MQINHSDAAGQAKAILGAWQTGNAQVLCEELDRVNLLSPDCYDQAETERMELLSAIVGELRVSEQPFGGDSAVYRNLLRHLALSEAPDVQRRSAIRPWKPKCAPAQVLATVLQ